MQTITLNIGLNTNTGGRLPLHKALTQVAEFLKIDDSRVAPSPSGDEQVLIVTGRTTWTDVTSLVYHASALLAQDCIAVVWQDGKGELIGPKAEQWGEFNPDFFVHIDETKHLQQVRDAFAASIKPHADFDATDKLAAEILARPLETSGEAFAAIEHRRILPI